MPADMVIIRASLVDQYRKTCAMGRVEFYQKLGIHFLTGAKLMRGDAVNLRTAKRIASVLGIEVQALIKSWKGDLNGGRKNLPVVGKTLRRTAQRCAATHSAVMHSEARQAEAVVGVTD